MANPSAPAAPRRPASEARRQEILDAALTCFLREGIAATSVDEIRAASGASVGSIYHHFGGKDGIVAALATDALADYQEGFVATLGRARSARGGIEAAVRYHLDWVEAHADLARFLFAGDRDRSAAADDAVRALTRVFLKDVAAWFDEHARAGALRALPLDLLGAVLVGPAQEFSRGWLARRSRSSMDAARQALPAAAWAALRPQDPTTARGVRR